MKKIIVLVAVACVSYFPGKAEGILAQAGPATFLDADMQNGRKAARLERKEARKARRAEYKQRNTGSGRSDYDRMMKDNIKQRKKMDKASRKENRRNWGSNELGDVFGVF